FDALQQETRKRGMLLIFDEAQTAFGRLGHWFAASHLNVTPDLMTVSKTLGGGIPLAAVITNDDIEATCHARGFAFYTSQSPIRCRRLSALPCSRRSSRSICSREA